MGMFVKTLWMTVSVFALILASVASSSAQTTVFVNGNKTFTVTWSGAWKQARLCSPRPRLPLATGRARHSDDGHQCQEHDAGKPLHQRTADGVRIRPDA